MFIEKLKESFDADEPIFSEEILRSFGNYSRAYIFRMIAKAERRKELVSFSRGVYFIPRKTAFGLSTISSEMVAEKKYIKSRGLVYGVYSGLSVLNLFGITTQVPNTIEIVTNNEVTRKRKVVINGREFIIRRSRCEITADNYAEYTLLQFLTDFDKSDVMNEFSKKQIIEYISNNSVSKDKLLLMTRFFPSATSKKLIGSGILNGAL